MQQSSVSTLVLQTVPEFRGRFEEFVDCLPHKPGMGSVMAEFGAFVGDISTREPYPYELVTRCLDMLEELLGQVDESDRIEIGASFFGDMPVGVITASLLWMGPRTLSALESLDD